MLRRALTGGEAPAVAAAAARGLSDLFLGLGPAAVDSSLAAAGAAGAASEAGGSDARGAVQLLADAAWGVLEGARYRWGACLGCMGVLCRCMDGFRQFCRCAAQPCLLWCSLPTPHSATTEPRRDPLTMRGRSCCLPQRRASQGCCCRSAPGAPPRRPRTRLCQRCSGRLEPCCLHTCTPRPRAARCSGRAWHCSLRPTQQPPPPTINAHSPQQRCQRRARRTRSGSARPRRASRRQCCCGLCCSCSSRALATAMAGRSGGSAGARSSGVMAGVLPRLPSSC